MALPCTIGGSPCRDVIRDVETRKGTSRNELELYTTTIACLRDTWREWMSFTKAINDEGRWDVDFLRASTHFQIQRVQYCRCVSRNEEMVVEDESLFLQAKTPFKIQRVQNWKFVLLSQIVNTLGRGNGDDGIIDCVQRRDVHCLIVSEECLTLWRRKRDQRSCYQIRNLSYQRPFSRNVMLRC